MLHTISNRTRSARTIAATLATLLAITLVAVGVHWSAAPTPAAAHTNVKSVRPSKGGTVKTDITLVAVIFDGSVRTARAIVTGPSGKVVSSGTRRDPRNAKRFQANLKGKATPGTYKVALSWTASDGHKQTYGWTFKVAK
ncbi:MAG: copper resistance protein CopC [Solirubrobacteraceae bacterium]|nr:copper resistance protein CopC [Solirubrobacteraceae bacterium]